MAAFTSALTGLQPGVLYYVRAYATNDQGTLYGQQFSFTTVAVPPAAEPAGSSTLTVSLLTATSVQLTFSEGAGTKHLVLAQLDGPVDQGPVDATTYSANAAFGQGQEIGSGNFVVAATADNTVTVTGLRANTPYSFALYDYHDNDTPYAENYRTTDPGTLSLTTPALPPTLLLQEDFAYAAGTFLTADGWAAHNGGGTKPLTVTSGSLTYPGYNPGTGNATALTGSGEDDNRQLLTTIYPRTTVYASFLVSVSSASTAGDYFLHLGPTVLSSVFRGRVFARKSATGTLQFGVVGSSATPVYTTTDYAFNTTYLLLLRYSFDETGNTTDLFINPPTAGVATTTPDLSVPENSSSSPPNVGTVALRQGTNSPVLTLDGLTVATAFPMTADAPLPVTLSTFTAQLSGRAVQLAWQTASEVNTDHFEVERSPDGQAFTPLHTLPAAGTSTSAHAYAWLDAQAAATGVPTLYYRLHVVDLDGTSSYSPVRTVALTPAAAGLALYPNPAHTSTTLTGVAPAAAVQVLDALGRVVLTATADATGTAALTLPAGLPSGVYVVRSGSQAVRLVVN